MDMRYGVLFECKGIFNRFYAFGIFVCGFNGVERNRGGREEEKEERRKILGRRLY